MQAADALAEPRASSAEVIDLRSLRPLDSETVVESVKKTNRLVTAEEGWALLRHRLRAGGADDGPGVRLARRSGAFRVAGADVPMPYAANLEQLALPQAEDIVQAAKDVCYAG